MLYECDFFLESKGHSFVADLIFEKSIININVIGVQISLFMKF